MADKPSPFDYVKYDDQSAGLQERYKKMFQIIHDTMLETLPESRPRALILHYIEIAYMWVGKAIRDEQIKRNSQVEHQPQRSNQ